MPEPRTAREDELEEMLAFDQDYGGGDTPLRAFRQQFEERPDLFVVYVEDGELVAEAYGRTQRPEEDPTESGDESVVLQSVAVKLNRQGEGLGRAVLEFFEEQARSYAETASAASAGDVEGFYRSCGYEPKMILLQIAEEDFLESDFAETYERAGEILGEQVTILGERVIDMGARFLYVGFEEYDPEVRRELAERFDAYEANTIYEKRL